ncbi:hypothetical protein VW29_09905 [Devosia limi DSM 17137]|uniref:VanZ like family protein n=1 Tax=Devosia limi DSM 17137 TaxID=1121477 RepID=A0A0F5LQS7_9HYPH|nr:hypothetical protein [Devosia limi]KKB84688.1 hypothetical protein VW29_09905 [Devosia limi DSM 17137]SHF53884.1 hypothetical protein SAMN02745223_02908 [Devosia limi DSM 17137]
MLNKIKTELSELLFLSRDALHIHIGLGIYIAAMVLFRRGPASIVPWLVVLVAQLANELLDGIHHGALDIDVTGALRDIGNTMLWPTVVLLIARRFDKKRNCPKLSYQGR